MSSQGPTKAAGRARMRKRRKGMQLKKVCCFLTNQQVTQELNNKTVVQLQSRFKNSEGIVIQIST